jgi:hypothetical protein
VIADIRNSQTSADFIAFLNKLNREVPKELDVHEILDSLQTHKAPLAHKWLLRTGASSSASRRPMGRGRTWSNSGSLESPPRSSSDRSIATSRNWPPTSPWAAVGNENPRPLVWTKSAEQRLERLAGYCAAINAGAQSHYHGRFNFPAQRGVLRQRLVTC